MKMQYELMSAFLTFIIKLETHYAINQPSP